MDVMIGVLLLLVLALMLAPRKVADQEPVVVIIERERPKAHCYRLPLLALGLLGFLFILLW